MAEPSVHALTTHRFASGVELSIAEESMESGAEWSIEGDGHAVILHLDGHLRGLRTELSGLGCSRREPQAGELWSIPAGKCYRGFARGGRVRYAMLRVPAVTHGAHHLALSALAPLAGCRDDFVHASVRELASVLAADPAERMFSEVLVESLVMHLGLRYGDAVLRGSWNEPGRPETIAAAQLEGFIRARLETTVRLHDLASFVGVKPAALAGWFRKVLGTTPWQFVIACRLERARELLADESLGLTQIALRCGFASHAHFTSCARRHWGESPSRVRAAFGQRRR